MSILCKHNIFSRNQHLSDVCVITLCCSVCDRSPPQLMVSKVFSTRFGSSTSGSTNTYVSCFLSSAICCYMSLLSISQCLHFISYRLQDSFESMSQTFPNHASSIGKMYKLSSSSVIFAHWFPKPSDLPSACCT